jgi:carotenoid cleavage dioxygenase-like enzyme
MNAPSAKSRFFQGPFAPVTEEITAFDLPLTGQLPVELNGRYLRNGPNPMSLDDPNYHWFLGTGMVHGVRLRDGRAEWYRNRWVRSNAVANVLGEKWPAGPVHGKDFAANTHIISHGTTSPHLNQDHCPMIFPTIWTRSARGISKV